MTRRIEIQAEQWPQRMADEVKEDALEPGEFFYNRDPALVGEQGHTMYDSAVGGDPKGAVSIRPREQAGPHDAFVMPAEESGLDYDAIVRRNPKDDGWDVLKTL